MARILLLVLALVACDRRVPRADRVVTVGSSITEAVYALGAGDRVAGADTSSLYPEAATRLPRVG